MAVGQRTAVRTDVAAPGTDAGLAVGALAWPGWTWARLPELWIVLAIGALLRLWALDVTPIGRDQVLQVQLARLALEHGAIPIGGLPASIGLAGSPLGIYLTLPFAAAGPSPLPVAASIALLNVLGVGACYVFALRCFGRRTALLAALLYATCAAAVDTSRIIWLPDYAPALLAFWALTLEAGIRRQRPGWLVPSVALFTMAVLLLPAAILLLPAMAVALVLAPVRVRSLLGAAAAVLFLLAPNLIWEVLSGGADLRSLGQYVGGQHGTIDLQVFYRIYVLLGGPISALQVEHPGSGVRWTLDLIRSTPTSTVFTGNAPYSALALVYLPLALAATALFALGWIVLTRRVARPLVQSWRAAVPMAEQGDERPRDRDLRTWVARAGATWRAVRSQPAWRVQLLLWICVTAPPALTLRHSGPIQPHYLLALYPFCFVTGAIGGSWLFERAGRLRVRAPKLVPASRRPALGAVAVAAALALLLAGQAAQSLLATASFASGAFDLGQHPATYTLAELQSADAALGRLEQQQGAREVVVLTTPNSQSAFSSLLAGDRPDRATVDDNCLTLPGPERQPALVSPSDPRHSAAQLLMTLPNARMVGSVPLPGADPLAVYRVQGQLPTLPDEHLITPVAFQSGADDGLRLDAVALVPPYGLRFRWTVLGTTPRGATPAGHHISLTLRRHDETQLAEMYMECDPTAWHAGDTLFTWSGFASLPGGTTITDLLGAQPSGTALVTVRRFQAGVDTHALGGATLISGWPVPLIYSPLATSLAPGAAAGDAPVGVGADGVTLTSADFAAP